MVLIRRVLGVALFVGLLVLGWQFANDNNAPVSVHHVAGQTEPMPIWLVVLLSWTLGLLMAGLYLGFSMLRDRIELRRLRKIVRGLEGELHGYRNKPLEEVPPGDEKGVGVKTQQLPATLGARGGR
jgi:uncharacterized integral membrane protein